MTDDAPEIPSLPPEEDRAGPLRRLHRRLANLEPEIVERVAMVGIVTLGIADLLVGPELRFATFYLAPIGLAAWYGARRAGPFMSFLAAGAWLGADLIGRDALPGISLAAWNTAMHLAGFLVVALLTARLRGVLAEKQALARLDSLTGLENTRAFVDRLELEIERSLRYGRVFTLAYLDLDRFKEVNDRLGHTVGDELLKRMARSMKATMRSTDVTARLGGDEFGIILPETPYAQAEQALEKLRRELLEVMRRGRWPVTISLGAVTFEAPVETSNEAVRMADRLMYEVKDEGRDGIRHILWTGAVEEGV